MRTNHHYRSWLQGGAKLCTFVIGSCVMGCPAMAADEKAAATAGDGAKPKAEKASETEAVEYRNWLDVSAGTWLINGDQAQFQRRYGQRKDAFGGIEEFHYEQDVGKKGLFQIDGRGLFDNHDYSLKLRLENPEIGYLRAGYTESRTWSDGSGGFMPQVQPISLFNEELTLDRGEAWFEGGLTLANKPQLSFRYSHQFRQGDKDSTSWGDMVTAVGSRGIAPSFWSIDEARDTFSGDVRHKVAKTDFGLGLRYEFSSSDNTRNLERASSGGPTRFTTQREGLDTDLFNVHAFTETRVHEKALLTTGYSFTTLDTDLAGYRLYGVNYDPELMAQRLPSPDTFEGLGGGSQLNQHVANLNLMVTLADSLILVPSLRVEKQHAESISSYDSPAAPFSSSPYTANSERGLLNVSESLELRYTGLTNWVFYSRANWLEGSGDLTETWENLGTGANLLQGTIGGPPRLTDDTRFEQKYSAGANWYPLRRLNFGAQYYHKNRQNDYDHGLSLPAGGLQYPAFLTAQEFDTDDANIRFTWRPHTRVTLIGRYDFQFSSIDTRPEDLPNIQTSEMTSHIVSGTVSWTPLNRLYVQAGANRVWDQTDTAADDISPAVQKSKNNYWTANSAIGYAVDDKTDVQLQYLYYRANNFEDNWAFGVPYGASAEEHGVTVGLIRRINQRIRWTMKYGFFDGRDKTSAHHNDYQAHLVSSSLHFRF